jgi:hypothetical protein
VVEEERRRDPQFPRALIAIGAVVCDLETAAAPLTAAVAPPGSSEFVPLGGEDFVSTPGAPGYGEDADGGPAAQEVPDRP